MIVINMVKHDCNNQISYVAHKNNNKIKELDWTTFLKD